MHIILRKQSKCASNEYRRGDLTDVGVVISRVDIPSNTTFNIKGKTCFMVMAV